MLFVRGPDHRRRPSIQVTHTGVALPWFLSPPTWYHNSLHVPHLLSDMSNQAQQVWSPITLVPFSTDNEIFVSELMHNISHQRSGRLTNNCPPFAGDVNLCTCQCDASVEGLVDPRILTGEMMSDSPWWCSTWRSMGRPWGSGEISDSPLWCPSGRRVGRSQRFWLWCHDTIPLFYDVGVLSLFRTWCY